MTIQKKAARGSEAISLLLEARLLASLASLMLPLLTACVPAFKPPAETILRVCSDGNARDEKVFGIRDVVWGQQDGRMRIIGCGWGHEQHRWVTTWLYMGFWPVGGIVLAPGSEERWLCVSRDDEEGAGAGQWRVELLLGTYFGGAEGSLTAPATQGSRRLRFADRTLFVGQTGRCGRDWLGRMRVRFDGLQMVSEKNPAHTIRVSGTVVARPASGAVLSQVYGSYRLLPVVEHLEASLESSRLVEDTEVLLDPLTLAPCIGTDESPREPGTRFSLWMHTAGEQPASRDEIHAVVLEALRENGLIVETVRLTQDQRMPQYWTADVRIRP